MVIQLPRGRGDGEANIRNGGSGTASGSSSVDADVVWATFPAVFLRDNCASAVHPKTRQRTVLVWELPPDLSIVTATWGHRQLPDGGIAAAGTGAGRFPRRSLQQHTECPNHRQRSCGSAPRRKK